MTYIGFAVCLQIVRAAQKQANYHDITKNGASWAKEKNPLNLGSIDTFHRVHFERPGLAFAMSIARATSGLEASPCLCRRSAQITRGASAYGTARVEADSTVWTQHQTSACLGEKRGAITIPFIPFEKSLPRC